ncbi:hypothetical protein Cs7R123_67780 [Catellatospora sp. TT07R-123]|uniref:hypothetical protein n=1 Tax=Catellatospora sp. TT07R-123 TaxID=2733863 RepID=UPI001B2331F3|nr:hypothetical protein [Catellatospora sp. TT07R-123]GHJ49436.1 hypothetical protein Cs7R123_67780 [Catellatospora sp. TT07R-123]
MTVSTPWRRLPAPARAIAQATADAVAAARARDDEELDAAAARLAGCDQAQVGVVLGEAVRLLIERLHPDGLSGEDVQAVFEQCARDALAWTDLDVDTLVTVLVGALGVHEPGDTPRKPDPKLLDRHAILLLAHLLAGAGEPLEPYLTAAFAEVFRSETEEMP